MRSLPCLLLLTAALAASSCGGGGGSCSGGFCDGLTFGTGVTGTGFTLAGPSDTFSLAAQGSSGQIWFRLESATTFRTRAGRLYINYPGSPPVPYWQKDYAGLQSDGHLLLSSFRVTDKGSWDVVAYLVESSGTETRVANRELTITE